jgi:hypothetical protein
LTVRLVGIPATPAGSDTVSVGRVDGAGVTPTGVVNDRPVDEVTYAVEAL